MAKAKKYLIENATVKPPRIDPKTGRDTRSLTEVNGHVVSFRDTEDRPHLIHPGRNGAIVPELNQGIINLARGGFVRIKEIDDVVQALKAHTLQADAPKPRQVTPRQASEEIAQGETAATTEDESQSAQRVRAVEMGKDNYEQRSGTEMDGAINPDGNPNFLVKAPRGGKHDRKRRAQESAE